MHRLRHRRASNQVRPILRKNNPRTTAPPPGAPPAQCLCMPLATLGGASICTTRSTAPISIPSSSDEVHTSALMLPGLQHLFNLAPLRRRQRPMMRTRNIGSPANSFSAPARRSATRRAFTKISVEVRPPNNLQQAADESIARSKSASAPAKPARSANRQSRPSSPCPRQALPPSTPAPSAPPHSQSSPDDSAPPRPRHPPPSASHPAQSHPQPLLHQSRPRVPQPALSVVERVSILGHVLPQHRVPHVSLLRRGLPRNSAQPLPPQPPPEIAPPLPAASASHSTQSAATAAHTTPPTAPATTPYALHAWSAPAHGSHR